MQKIQVQGAAKRFQQEWIFKNLNLELSLGDSLAVTGGNGSGKSTFLKCLSGAIPLTQGDIHYLSGPTSLPADTWYTYLSIATPYLELPEEFTLSEAISFHFQFKTSLKKMLPSEILEILDLKKHEHKAISQFSSGMKQRVKLGLAIFSEVPLLLLDEPTSNLDKQGVSWYLDTMKQYSENRIVVICSNETKEYDFCQKKIDIETFK